MAQVFDWLDPSSYDDLNRCKTLHALAMANGGNVVIAAGTCKSYIMDDDKVYPITVDLLDLNANYMGSPTGVWDGDNSPDQEHLNNRPLYDLTYCDVSQDVIDQRGEMNVIALQYVTPYNVFYPAFLNVNIDVVMAVMFLPFVVATVVHLNHSNWKKTVGGSLSDSQYAERNIEYLNREISKRFDPRFTYIVDSYTTEADKKRRFSWTTSLVVLTPGVKTVIKLKLTVGSIVV